MIPLDRLAATNRLSARHPSEKLLFAGGLLFLGMIAPPAGQAVLLVLMLLATLGIARIPWRAYLWCLAAPLLFLGTGLLPFFLSFSHGIRLTLEGGGLAFEVTMRSLAALSCLLFLALTTPLPDLLGFLRRLRVPASLIEVASLMYRFLFLFLETARTMLVAQQARLGYRDLETSLRSSSMLLRALLRFAFTRARRLEYGLAARGWPGSSGELGVLSREKRCSRWVLGGIALGEVVLGWIILKT